MPTQVKDSIVSLGLLYREGDSLPVVIRDEENPPAFLARLAS